MAKTKWVVPAIAMVLCAASLIGAGYAAYTATLNDAETTTVDNNYVVVSYGANPTVTHMDIEYDTVNTYTNGAGSSVSYEAKDTKSVVLSFKVTETNQGDATNIVTYNAAVNSLTLSKANGSAVTLGTATASIYMVVDENEDFTIGVVKYKATTTVTADNTTMYYVIVNFTAADGNAAITTNTADMAATLNFTLSVTTPA